MTITLITAGLAGLILIWLSLKVSLWRVKTKTLIGSGGSAELERAIRAQGNFVEYAPLMMILLGLLETGGALPLFVLILAATFLVGRLSHAHGIANFARGNAFRAVGTVLTWLSVAVGSLAALLIGFNIL